MYQSDTFVRAEDAVSRLVQDETLIVPVRGKVGDLASIFSLKGVGTTVWSALAEPKSLNELTELIVSEYEVSPNQAAADLEALLADLLKHGLCVTASPK